MIRNFMNWQTEFFVNVQGRGDLETHRCGDHDFFEAAIWELKTALTEAYELGRSSK